MTEPKNIHPGQVLTGPLFNEPMRVETVSLNGADSWTLGCVGLHSERFRRVTLSANELKSLTILSETLTFDGDAGLLRLGIQAYSLGRLQEGRDYQCAFYGGSLLARTQFKSPEEAEAELVNLFRVNPNIVVICDGDRAAKGSRVKDRVRRIRAEVMKIPNAHVWITNAREIENYIPGTVLANAVGPTSLPDPDQYEIFFPRKGAPKASYVEKKMKRKGLDKMDLAILSVPHMDKATMLTRFEWGSQMQEIVDRISAWNR
jgi:putative ATP-dependent endonuclease of the OLD family